MFIRNYGQEEHTAKRMAIRHVNRYPSHSVDITHRMRVVAQVKARTPLPVDHD
jgi:hypothetical protein